MTSPAVGNDRSPARVVRRFRASGCAAFPPRRRQGENVGIRLESRRSWLRFVEVQIIAALFLDSIDVRSLPGPTTRLDLTGVQFSAAAPGELPVLWAPHLVVIVHCEPGGEADGVLEVVYERDGETLARNVQPLHVEPGKFNYRLVRAELTFETYGTVEARCRLAGGEDIVVPYTLLPPPEG